jgi:hypothetical protein
MRGIVRVYQNGNTVDIDCGAFTAASALHMQLSHEISPPDVHVSLWTTPDDTDLSARRREGGRGPLGSKFIYDVDEITEGQDHFGTEYTSAQIAARIDALVEAGHHVQVTIHINPDRDEDI